MTPLEPDPTPGPRSPNPTTVLLATTNPHKLDEIRAIFEGADVAWRTLADLGGDVDEPVEDQPTFEGNAMLKARYYASASGMTCLADDSGLEVDALGGRPGVHSARYAGTGNGRDERDVANNTKLLRELAEVPVEQRAARFVCVLAWHAAESEARPITARGTVEGRILLPHEADDPSRPERGRRLDDHGFGYDPLFVLTAGPETPPEHLGKTTAQLTPEQKNTSSHRGRAARKLRRVLRERHVL